MGELPPGSVRLRASADMSARTIEENVRARTVGNLTVVHQLLRRASALVSPSDGGVDGDLLETRRV